MVGDTAIVTERRIDGELRFVATLMADVAGSAEITEKLGSERSFLLMQDIVGLSWTQIQAMRGFPLNFTGDGIFAVFGAPLAVERASLIACQAAVAISDLLDRESERLLQTYGVSPRMRFGIASGEVLVTGLELGGLVNISANGSAVNLASRLQNLAPIGGIVCSSTVVTEVGPRATFTSLGSRKLKGYAEEQEVFELVVLRPGKVDDATSSANKPTPCVGRDAELAQIAKWMSDAQGMACLVIEGEAGIGKSRLLSEGLRSAAEARKPIIGFCTTETVRRPLYPLIEIMRRRIGWHPDSDLATTQMGLVAFFPDCDAHLGLLADLVSGRSSDDERKANDEALLLREQLISCMVALGTRPDCLLVIEDAHWIDPLSAGVLAAIVESRIPGFRIVMTQRSAPGKDWLPATLTLHLPLCPLSRSDIAVIARDGKAVDGMDSGFIDLVAEKSEGNPFFATEMLRHFDGRDARRLSASGIGTIQNLVFARFDPLDSATKKALRIAAAIGRSFSLNLFRRVAGLSVEETNAVFESAAGLIEASTLDGVDIGQFSHVLWRETIHGSIPSTRRAEIHRQIGEMLEALEDHNLSSMSETLVYHFEQGAVPDKAVVYLGVAARNAHRLYALETCDAHFDRAFALIFRSPDLVTDQAFGEMLKLWTTCLDQIGNFFKVQRVLSAHLPRLEGDPTNPHYSECLSMLAIAHCHMGNFKHSLELVDTAIGAAERADNARAVATAKVVKIRVIGDSGLLPFDAGQALFEETQDVADSLENMHLTITRLYYFISLHRSLGRFAGARKWNDALQSLAVTTRDRHAMVVARWSRGVLSVLANDIEKSLDDLAESRKQAVPGTGHWMVADSAHYSARMRAGEEVPREVFSSVVVRCEEYGDATLRNATLVNLTMWYFLQGKVRMGWKHLLLAEEKFRETGTTEARIHIKFLRAEILLSIAGLGMTKGAKRKFSYGDIFRAITIRPTARRQAHRILTDILGTNEALGGFFAGRANLGLAILARAGRQPDKASTLFNQSIAQYEAEGLAGEADRARKLAQGIVV